MEIVFIKNHGGRRYTLPPPLGGGPAKFLEAFG